jgi:hypothetical protein
MKTQKSVEELRQESSRMRTLGTMGAVISITGAVFAGLVSVQLAAGIGLGGLAIAAVSLFKKLSDDRAVAKQMGATDAELVLTR